MVDAGIDEPRFLAAGDDFDRKAERFVRAQQEGVAVARFAQRLRCHRAHVAWFEGGQARREPPQARQAALRGLFGEDAAGVQAGAQADGFLEVVDAAVTTLGQGAELEPEAVRPHVDGGKGGAGLQELWHTSDRTCQPRRRLRLTDPVA